MGRHKSIFGDVKKFFEKDVGSAVKSTVNTVVAVAKDPKVQHDVVAVLGSVKKEVVSDVSLVANGIQHFEQKQMDMVTGGITKVGGALSGPIMIAGAVVGLIVVYKIVKG
jgi:hypothetical protein